jgi:hypothetical protein
MLKLPTSRTPVLIPQTPAPRPIESIHVDHKKCFGGIIYVQKDSTTNIEDYFVEYDHWEKYSETKSYSRRVYQAAYKGMMKEYQNFLIIFEDDDKEEYYVVAKRIRNELELLEPYCQCCRCVCSTLNPLKYLWCPHCTSCIKSGPGFAKQEYIDKARELKLLMENKRPVLSKYQKYTDKLSLIKGFELLFLVLLLLLFFSYV